MDLSDLIAKQIIADRQRGFPVDFISSAERLTQLERDLIGLAGEVGEFANALKKVRLGMEVEGYQAPTLEEAAFDLRQELADAFIYIIRLSFILDGNLKQDLLDKMAENDLRYGKLEHK